MEIQGQLWWASAEAPAAVSKSNVTGLPANKPGRNESLEKQEDVKALKSPPNSDPLQESQRNQYSFAHKSITLGR